MDSLHSVESECRLTWNASTDLVYRITSRKRINQADRAFKQSFQNMFAAAKQRDPKDASKVEYFLERLWQQCDKYGRKLSDLPSTAVIPPFQAKVIGKEARFYIMNVQYSITPLLKHVFKEFEYEKKQIGNYVNMTKLIINLILIPFVCCCHRYVMVLLDQFHNKTLSERKMLSNRQILLRVFRSLIWLQTAVQRYFPRVSSCYRSGRLIHLLAAVHVLLLNPYNVSTTLAETNNQVNKKTLLERVSHTQEFRIDMEKKKITVPELVQTEQSLQSHFVAAALRMIDCTENNKQQFSDLLIIHVELFYYVKIEHIQRRVETTCCTRNV